MNKIIVFLLVCFLPVVVPFAEPNEKLTSITIQDTRFVDQSGRQVILHGINVGGLDKQGEEWSQPKDNFPLLHQWGFNCIRMQIHWSEIEPECGKYDEVYLKALDQRIKNAVNNGLYVFLDMHQDLWGPKSSGDGAPLWATLDEGKPHLKPGPLWSDAYMTSPMVQTAFDNFWKNAPGPDGVGIQDRFALAWQQVVKRYTECPAVIGYEILNEPSSGSIMQEAGKMMAESMVSELTKLGLVSENTNPMTAWFNPELRNKILIALNDPKLYLQFVVAPEPVFQKFERGQLSAMYRRLASAIRKAEPNKILFFEPDTSSIMGSVSDFQPITDAQGKRDAYQALVPHAYDLVTDLPNSPMPTLDRIRLIMERLRSLSSRLNMPVILGEWGAYPGDRRTEAQFIVNELESWLAGDTYWIYSPDLGKAPHIPMLNRPYPMAVTGKVSKYHFDPDTQVFTCEWEETMGVKEPSRFFIPERFYPQGITIETTPVKDAASFIPMEKDSRNGYVIIPPADNAGTRSITIRPVKK